MDKITRVEKNSNRVSKSLAGYKASIVCRRSCYKLLGAVNFQSCDIYLLCLSHGDYRGEGSVRNGRHSPHTVVLSATFG